MFGSFVVHIRETMNSSYPCPIRINSNLVIVYYEKGPILICLGSITMLQCLI